MPGGLDANGIYQYAEDDDAAPDDGFSDLLNLGMASVSGVVADISTRLQPLENPATLVWTDATFPSGFTHVDLVNNKVQWAVRNKTVYWRGLCRQISAGATVNQGLTQTIMVNLPSVIRPINNWNFITYAFNNNVFGRLTVDGLGGLGIYRQANAATAGSYIALDGVTYPLG